MAERYINPVPQYLDTGGESIAGARVFFFEAGTSTPLDTYTDETLVTPNSNPVVCDGDGRLPAVFLSPVDYKVVLKEADEDVTIWERDPVDGNVEGSGPGGEIDTYAELKALGAGFLIEDATYYVNGRTTSGDGGEGHWRATQTSPGADNDGTILHSDTAGWYFERQYTGPVKTPWFGSVGDGASAAADQAAIDAAVATGEDVFIPDALSQYDLTTTVTVTTAGQRIFGSGEKCLIVQAGTNASSNVFFVDTADDVELFGMNVTPGTTTDATLQGTAFYAKNSDRIKIHDNFVSGHRKHGVLLQNVQYSEVYNNNIRDSVVNPATDEHPQAGTDILLGYGCSHNAVYGNVISDGAGTGISVQSINAATNNDHNTIYGNNIFGAKIYGISLYRTDAALDTVEYNLVFGNNIDTVYGNIEHATEGFVFGAGIYVQGAEHSIVNSNQIKNTNINTITETLAPGGIGIINVRHVEINGNMITGAVWYGMAIFDNNSTGLAAYQAIITNNAITGSTKNGLYLKDFPRAIISGNDVSHGSSNGIRIVDAVTSTSDNYIITDNFCNDNTASGLVVNAGDYCNVSNNTVDNNSVHGISIATDTAVVRGNRAVNNTVRGFQTTSAVTDGLLAENFSTGNGTGVTGNGTVRLINNIVSGNSVEYGGSFPLRRTLDSNATPTVNNGELFLTGDTTTITDFDDGYDGQTIFIKFSHAKTITHGSPIKLNGSADFVGASGDTLTLENISDVWYEQSRMVA